MAIARLIYRCEIMRSMRSHWSMDGSSRYWRWNAQLCPKLLRFYAGAPLITPDGRALGTLCVIASLITYSGKRRAPFSFPERLQQGLRSAFSYLQIGCWALKEVVETRNLR